MNGMGCDSFERLHQWLTNPNSRDFDLADLIVLTAMTGNEFSKTGELMERHLFPLLAAANVRTVQVMKAGPHVRDGYTVLDDSRAPTKCWLYGWSTPPFSEHSAPIPYDRAPLLSPLHPLWHPDIEQDLHEGLWAQPPEWDDGLAGGSGLSLGQHFTQQGTVPQYREKRRDCSFKSKGTNLDAATIDLVLGAPTLALGENLISTGAIPQYGGQGRICSDQHKAEELQQATVALVNGNNDRPNSTHSLGSDLLAGGAIPQTRRGKGSGKCSDKAKQVVCNQWVDQVALTNGADPVLDAAAPITYPHSELPPYVKTAVFFNADETYRQERGEFAQEKKRQKLKRPRKPPIYRINWYPSIAAGVTRAHNEAYAARIAGEDFWRSACTFCPFSAISGPKEEVLIKHRLLPNESGYALLLEYISRCLNERQTLYPKGRSLYQMILDDGNWEALENFMARRDALGWALYRVQRIYGKAVPWRRTQILATGTRDEMNQEFIHHGKALGATPFKGKDDGIWRAWIESRQLGYCEVQDMLVVCPHVPIEKHRPGWAQQWHGLHNQQVNLLELI